jgi:hypothetical protein
MVSFKDWGETSVFIEPKVVSEKEMKISNQCQPLNYNSTAHQRQQNYWDFAEQKLKIRSLKYYNKSVFWFLQINFCHQTYCFFLS